MADLGTALIAIRSSVPRPLKPQIIPDLCDLRTSLNGKIIVMRLKLLPRVPSAGYELLPRRLPLPLACLRYSSTLSSLLSELKSRPLNITYDYICPTPSYLLNVSLRDFLPGSCQSDYSASNSTLPYIAPANSSTSQQSTPLPQGHHLVYFPPPLPQHALLPDGTDTLHSPRSPTSFTRRLWAGGSTTFNPSPKLLLRLDGGRAVCVEGIRDVTIRGREGDEKVFVHIERRYGYVNPSPDGRVKHEDEHMEDGEVVRRFWKRNQAAVVERRDLVFLRTSEKKRLEGKAPDRIVKPLLESDLSISLIPTPSLLFRFSALTFNAHLIHLDPRYSCEVEGRQGLIVHGPLSLVLMLSVLQSQLTGREMIASFTYRNLAPLFSGEEMTICLRRDREDRQMYEVWIEGKTGGYAVKGSATIVQSEIR